MTAPTQQADTTRGDGWWKRRSLPMKIALVIIAIAVVGGLAGLFDDGDGEPAATPQTAPTQETASAPATDPTPEPVASEFTVDHDPHDLDGLVPGGVTTVTFEIADNFSSGLIASGAQRATFDAIETALTEQPDTGRVVIEGTFPTVDDHGNENPDSVILRPFYDRATIDQIDFDNQHAVDIWAIRDGGMVHPDLLDN